MTNDMPERDRILRYREKQFLVKVTESRASRSRDPYVPAGECSMSVTFNGSQWQTLCLSEVEARKVVEAVANHYGWECARDAQGALRVIEPERAVR